MISLPTSDTGKGLAQTGWAVDYTVKNEVFYYFGWMNSDGLYHEKYTGYGPAVGSNHHYKVVKNGSAVDCYIDGAKYFSQTIDWTPGCSQYEGEIKNTDAQFPGKTSLHEVFSSILYKDTNGNYYTPFLQKKAESYGNNTIDSGSQTSTFDCWDTRY